MLVLKSLRTLLLLQPFFARRTLQGQIPMSNPLQGRIPMHRPASSRLERREPHAKASLESKAAATEKRKLVEIRASEDFKRQAAEAQP